MLEEPLTVERYLPNEAGPVQPRPARSATAKIKPRTRFMTLSYPVASQLASPLGLLGVGWGELCQACLSPAGLQEEGRECSWNPMGDGIP